MTQVADHYAHLGLEPGLYSSEQLAGRLLELRRFAPDDYRLAEAVLAFCVLADPQRQQRCLAELAGADESGPASPPASRADIESAFMAAVRYYLEGESGVLRYTNRSKLLAVAGRLGIGQFEANLLIERARFQADRSPSDGDAAAPAIISRRRAGRLARWLIVITVALLLDGLLLMLLMR